MASWSENIKVSRDENKLEVSETDAVKSCVKKTARFFIVSQATLEARDLQKVLSVIGEKMLLLYFHNDEDEFSKTFCRSLAQTAMKTALKNFCILGWDVGETKYHDALVKVLSENHLQNLVCLVESKVSAVICLQMVDGSAPEAVLCLTGEMSESEILKQLEESQRKINESKPSSFSTSEMDAVHSCITKTAPFHLGVKFEIKELKQLYSESSTSKKSVVLFLYNELDKFSKTFCDCLADTTLKNILEGFIILGWDVGDSKYHNILSNTLSSYNLDFFGHFVESKVSALIFLKKIDETLMAIGYLDGDASHSDILTKLRSSISLPRLSEFKNVHLKKDDSGKSAPYYFDSSEKKFEKKELKEILAECCFAPFDQRKKVLLCLHNGNDVFFEIFRRNVKKTLKRILETVCILGCNVGKAGDHKAILRTLNSNELQSLNSLVENKTSAVIRLHNVDGCIEPLRIEKESVSYGELLKLLTYEDNNITSKRYQQLMADMLGDRDYDLIDFDQKEVLESKVGFALYGPPQDAETRKYNSDQVKKINKLCKVIMTQSNQVSQYLDQVEISFIYNCVEPLEEEMEKRAKKYENYNPNEDLMPIPLFILRKCRDARHPCRIFIDDTERVYSTWQDYKENNKLHKCIMVLPYNGRYEVDENGNVLLETITSPACSAGQKVLKAADIANTGVGLATGAVFATAAFTAVLPAVVVTAGIAGAVTGVYAITRSIVTLNDKSKHKESIDFFASSEARGAYLNIIAGALGFAGTGANMLVAQLATRGVNIGKGAIYTVNTVNVLNLGASGANVINSGADVINQWICENKTPSLLTLVQLGSSVLFFGNAVYNFKTAGNIIEESQATTMREYQNSLRSNRHRKIFDKMMKETIRQNDGNASAGRAEVIKTVRNIQNKDEVFAALTRNNKQMNKNGIRFSADNGQIKLNGQNVDMRTFMSMTNNEANLFLGKLPIKPNVTPADVKSMEHVYTINDITNKLAVSDWKCLLNHSVKLIGIFHGDVQSKIISALNLLLSNISSYFEKMLKELFPDAYSKYVNLFNVVVEFFGHQARELDEQYEKWKITKNQEFYHPLFSFVDTDEQSKCKKFLEDIVRACFNKGKMREEALKRLVSYVETWIAEKLFEKGIEDDKKQKREVHSSSIRTKLVKCDVCGGNFFSKIR